MPGGAGLLPSTVGTEIHVKTPAVSEKNQKASDWILSNSGDWDPKPPINLLVLTHRG